MSSHLVLHWLPVATDFRGDLRTALAAASAAERLERLARLAQHRIGYVETIQLDRALGQTAPESASGFTPVRLAMLSSSTVDHLAPAIRISGLRRRLLIHVHLGPYGQYRQELLQQNSALRQFGPDIVLLSLSAREVLAATPVTATAAEVDAAVDRTIAQLQSLWRVARQDLGATVIQQTFLNVADPLFGSYDRLAPAAPLRIVDRLNDRLAARAADDGVLLLDIAGASERDGLHAWFDAARWLHGKLEIAPQAAPHYGELVVRIVAAARGQSRKCLVLDLDNTLWGGVIGDDGVDGIVLGEGSASGEAYLALQRYARRLKDRGIILAVCSRNDSATVEAAFDGHPEMVLKRSDIAAFVANWNDKAENLRLVADRLNLGLDSLVFVDDNPAERARIRQSLPMVAVPELPADPAEYVRCVAESGYFEAVAFSPEDRRRGEHYAANASRDALRGSSSSLDHFLRDLEMTVIAGPFQEVDVVRITQLINKTNQFNPTTSRYNADAVTRFAKNGCLTLQFRLLDRFGDNGIVSAMILRPAAHQGDALEIDTWVMSCRVFGRQLEFEAMNIAVDAARSRGVRAVYADYLPTPKNGVVSDLYAQLGFRAAGSSAAASGTRWSLRLSDYVNHPTHIASRAV